MTIEGTWEEIVRCSDLLAGHHVRVLVLDVVPDEESPEELEPTWSHVTWDQEADAVAHLLSPLWPEAVSAAEAVAEQRR